MLGSLEGAAWAQAIAEYLELPFLKVLPQDPRLLEQVLAMYSGSVGCFPFDWSTTACCWRWSTLWDEMARDDMALVTGFEIDLAITADEAIGMSLPPRAEEPAPVLFPERSSEDEKVVTELEAWKDDPAARLLSTILVCAIQDRASEIILEGGADSLSCRGQLHEVGRGDPRAAPGPPALRGPESEQLLDLLAHLAADLQLHQAAATTSDLSFGPDGKPVGVPGAGRSWPGGRERQPLILRAAK